MSSITDIEGVYASGCSAEIYDDPERLDLAFIFVPECKASAGVFTRNKFRAACVDYGENLQEAGHVFKAVIINAGNANAATGNKGKENVIKTAQLAAEKLSIRQEEVAIASTGIIGVQLPIEKITKGLTALLAEPLAKDANKAANAILTLDTREKLSHEEQDGIIVSGFAKGAGMIAPNMATMLGFIVTNADLSSESLRKELREAVEVSFNMVSVDTDTSTNDLVITQSTGTESIKGKENVFSELLTKVCTSLAKQIAADGEGAEKLIEVNVSGAQSKEEAIVVAKNIVNSPLVKTAVHGSDPNWGRLMMATGKNPDINFEAEKVEVHLCSQMVFSCGGPTEFNRKALSDKLKERSVVIDVNLNAGSCKATSWGCELTKEYVDINTEYN